MGFLFNLALPYQAVGSDTTQAMSLLFIALAFFPERCLERTSQ